MKRRKEKRKIKNPECQVFVPNSSLTFTPVPNIIPSPIPSTEWESDLKIVKECGMINKKAKTIHITQQVMKKIKTLLHYLPQLEWLGYLTIENNIITDITIPSQEVSFASVEVITPSDYDGIIHSHHKIGAFHSLTDLEGGDANNQISLVIDNKRNIVGIERVELPCGAYCFREIKVEEISDFDKEWYEKIKQNITVKEWKKESPIIEPYYQYQSKFLEEEF